MNLLFSINEACLHLLKTCLKSIVRYHKEEDLNVYVLHSDLAEKAQNELKTYFKNIHFHFIEIDPKIFKDFPSFKRYPIQIYYRLIAPLLLPEDVERILYLDVDTIIIKSLDELYHMDFEGKYYIATSHTRRFLTRFNHIRLGIRQKEIPYINTGVLLMNVKHLKEVILIGEIQAFVQKKKKVLWLPDQDILTALYGQEVKLVDPLLYNLSDRTLSFYNLSHKESIDLKWVEKHSVIIHYFGKNKPWKKDYRGILKGYYEDVENVL